MAALSVMAILPQRSHAAGTGLTLMEVVMSEVLETIAIKSITVTILELSAVTMREELLDSGNLVNYVPLRNAPMKERYQELALAESLAMP